MQELQYEKLLPPVVVKPTTSRLLDWYSNQPRHEKNIACKHL